MTKVIHHRARQSYEAPYGDGSYVYCGRPSRFGNPFKIGERHPDTGEPMTRADVIEQFRLWWFADAQTALREDAYRALPDKTLGCWCKPQACHCDVIAEDVNTHPLRAAGLL